MILFLSQKNQIEFRNQIKNIEQNKLEKCVKFWHKELRELQYQSRNIMQNQEKIKNSIINCEKKSKKWKDKFECFKREGKKIHSQKAFKQHQYYEKAAFDLRKKRNEIAVIIYFIQNKKYKLISLIVLAKIKQNTLKLKILRNYINQKINNIEKWENNDRELENIFIKILLDREQLSQFIKEIRQAAQLWNQYYQKYTTEGNKKKARKSYHEKQFYMNMLQFLQPKFEKLTILVQAVKQDIAAYQSIRLERRYTEIVTEVEKRIKVSEEKIKQQEEEFPFQIALQIFNARQKSFKEEISKIEKVVSAIKTSEKTQKKIREMENFLEKRRYAFLHGFICYKLLQQYYEEAKENAKEKLASFEEFRQNGDQVKARKAKQEVELYLDIAQSWQDRSNELTELLGVVKDDIMARQHKLTIAKVELDIRKFLKFGIELTRFDQLLLSFIFRDRCR